MLFLLHFILHTTTQHRNSYFMAIASSKDYYLANFEAPLSAFFTGDICHNDICKSNIFRCVSISSNRLVTQSLTQSRHQPPIRSFTYSNLNKAKYISQEFISHVLGISQAYLGYISGIPQIYLRYISGIS